MLASVKSWPPLIGPYCEKTDRRLTLQEKHHDREGLIPITSPEVPPDAPAAVSGGGVGVTFYGQWSNDLAGYGFADVVFT